MIKVLFLVIIIIVVGGEIINGLVIVDNERNCSRNLLEIELKFIIMSYIFF